MSYPANFIVIENRIATVTHSSQGAPGVLYNFTSPRDAKRYSGCGDTVDWLDDCAEGGYLIDFDNTIGIVFGGSHDEDTEDQEAVAINNAIESGESQYIELMKSEWPGWSLHWGDIPDFREHLSKFNISHPLKSSE